MKIPIFSHAESFVTIKRLFLYCLYYTIFCHFLSIIYSMQQVDFEFEPNFVYMYLFIFTFVICLIVSIFTIGTSDFIIGKFSDASLNINFCILSLTSIINSILYIVFSYFVLSSPESPIDLFRAIEIAIPFFLSNILCLVL